MALPVAAGCLLVRSITLLRIWPEAVTPVSLSAGRFREIREFFTGIGRVATCLSLVFRILTGAGLARGPDFPVFPEMFSVDIFLKELLLL